VGWEGEWGSEGEYRYCAWCSGDAEGEASDVRADGCRLGAIGTWCCTVALWTQNVSAAMDSGGKSRVDKEREKRGILNARENRNESLSVVGGERRGGSGVAKEGRGEENRITCPRAAFQTPPHQVTAAHQWQTQPANSTTTTCPTTTHLRTPLTVSRPRFPLVRIFCGAQQVALRVE